VKTLLYHSKLKITLFISFFFFTSLVQCRKSISDIAWEDEQGSETEAQKNALCVYMQVKPESPNTGVPVYSSASSWTIVGYAGPKIPVTRQLTLKVGEETRMRVRFGYGSLAGEIGWVSAEDLEIRPTHSDCINRLSEISRWADEMDANLIRQTAMCFVGLGNGAISGFKGLATGMWSMVSGILKRDLDILKAMAGDSKAYSRLVQAGQNDEATARALLGLATQAIPLIRLHIAREFPEFMNLPPARQSEVMCGVLGGMSASVLSMAAGSAVTGLVTKGNTVTIQTGKITIPKLVADEIEDAMAKAAPSLASKVGPSVTGAALTAYEKLQWEALNYAMKIIVNCKAGPTTCLGIAAGASADQITAAYTKVSGSLHPNKWIYKAQNGSTSQLSPAAAKRMQQARAAVDQSLAQFLK
jgi:hypothetical protein